MTKSEAPHDVMEESIMQWCEEARNILNGITKQEKKLSLKVDSVKDARTIDKKNKAIRENQVMRKARRELKAEQKKLADHIAEHAKRECRLLCEKAHKMLPQELRDMICDNIIAARNATFYHGDNALPAIANGRSLLEHCFDPEYTGKGLHKDMVAGLSRAGSRFDFRGRHELLKTVFDQYLNEFDVDLTTMIKDLGIFVNEGHLKTRDAMLNHMQQLFRLEAGTSICFFVETGGRLQTQILRHLRCILRVLFSLLQDLRTAGYNVRIIANPPYVSSQVRNSSRSTFSIVPHMRLCYEITSSGTAFTLIGLETQMKNLFEDYGRLWYLRTDPPDDSDGLAVARRARLSWLMT